MPDENKYKKLREVGYTIRPICAFCTHRNFTTTLSLWGECKKHRYDHLKHDNPEGGRGISIIAWGSCSEIELDENAIGTLLGAHYEFLTTHKGDCGDCSGPDCEGCEKLPEGMVHGPGVKAPKNNDHSA